MTSRTQLSIALSAERLEAEMRLRSEGDLQMWTLRASGPRFDIELLQEGNRYYVGLTKQISPEIELDEKIEFSGVGDAVHPHIYNCATTMGAGPRGCGLTVSKWLRDLAGTAGFRKIRE